VYFCFFAFFFFFGNLLSFTPLPPKGQSQSLQAVWEPVKGAAQLLRSQALDRTPSHL